MKKIIIFFLIFFSFSSLSFADGPTSLLSCTDTYDPVCGIIDGQKKTYTNSCSAEFNGAEILYKGKCIVIPCPNNYQPVCAKRYHRNRTYQNECQAKWHGAKILYQGKCLSYVCRGKQDKVCAEKDGKQKTYLDYCAAMNDRAEVLYTGMCQIESTITSCPEVMAPNFTCAGSLVPIRGEDGCTTGFECIKDKNIEVRAVDKTPKCEVVGEYIDFLYRQKLSYGRFLTVKNNSFNSDLAFKTNGYTAYLSNKYRNIVIEGDQIIFVGITPILIFPDDVVTKAAAALEVDSGTASQIRLELNGNQTIYKVYFTKKAKILGLIGTTVKMTVSINPETGQVIEIDKPWYI